MKFTDLLRAGGTLSGVAAATLAGSTVLFGITTQHQAIVVVFAAVWVVAATLAAVAVSRRGGRPATSVQRLLADAKPQRIPEEPKPARTTTARLWPLGVLIVFGVVGGALIGPQVPGCATAAAAMLAIVWRAEESAVRAVEERDGVVFLVVSSNPIGPMKLVRGPGLRRDHPSFPTRASSAE